MKARELKEKFVKDDKLDQTSVIAIKTDALEQTKMWHVHDDEELPEEKDWESLHIAVRREEADS